MKMLIAQQTEKKAVNTKKNTKSFKNISRIKPTLLKLYGYGSYRYINMHLYICKVHHVEVQTEFKNCVGFYSFFSNPL